MSEESENYESNNSESQEEVEVVEESEEVENEESENGEEDEESESPKEKKKPSAKIQKIEEIDIDNDNSFIISLQLVKKFNELHQGMSDKSILDYIKKIGLPMHFQNQKMLGLYLYFHKMCSQYYNLFAKISKKEITKAVLNCLKDSYYLLVDKEIKHFNYGEMAKKAFPKLKISEEDTDISKIPIILQSKIAPKSPDFQIKKLILELGFQSHGRLDVYVKIHIIKSLIIFLNKSELMPYTQIFAQMEDDLMKLYNNSTKEKLSQERYDEMVTAFANGEMRDKWKEHLVHCRKLLGIFQNVNDDYSIKILEKLFIQLLGHFDRDVRNYAVKILNMIYDETTWQEKSAFPQENTKIKLLDDNLTLELIIRDSDFSENSVILIVSAPSQNKNVNYQCLTFLRAAKVKEEKNTVRLYFPIGNLSKCGYYDWYLVKFSKGRFTNIKIVNKNNETFEGKGRYIVLNKDIKDLSVHEVFCDLTNAQIDKTQGKILKRGSFQNLENKLDEFQQRYINCLYVMGALERDNDIAYDEVSGEPIDIGNDTASPMAVTSRCHISSLLGGDKAFKSLMNKAHKLSIKVIIDSLARISSSRAHRKYRNILLRYLDEQGKTQICYGSDGKSVRYEDSAVLNYRKVEAWDILVEEIKVLVDKYKIDGIHLDNCQAWPQIMEVDAAEMYRIDIDGKPAYTPMEILNGEIVMPNAESGYWDTDNCETYANPLLIKLTKNIWLDHPEFVFIGECWLNEKFSQRHINLSKSGIIPRMYTLPIIVCSMLGKQIQRNGTIESVQPSNVDIIKDWYSENYEGLPEGALLVQSSSGQVWPYPALLYGRGNWSAVDLLFGLPDVPMTFMDEIDGEAYRVQITNVYESKDAKSVSSHNTSSTGLRTRSKSLLKIIETKEQERRDRESGKRSLSRSGSLISLSDYMPSYSLMEGINSLINLSGVEVKQANEIETKQQDLVKQLGPEQGFDLNKIKYHYDNRRKMRYVHESLRRGKLIYLNALDNTGKPHPGIFAFARQTQEETGIFVINFRENDTNFLLDLSNLLGKEGDFNTICYIEDWEGDEKGEYYFLKELTQEHASRKIGGYQSICFGFSIVPFTQENYKRTMEKSNSRMVNEIKKQEKNEEEVGVEDDTNASDSHQITIQLKEILSRNLSLEEFNKWMSSITDILTKYNVSFPEYVHRLDFISTDEKLTTAFFKYCFKLGKTKSMNLGPLNTKLAKEAENIVNSNILGPICFVTPELGRWSTVGGLGVMVDELSQGLACLGQEVYMISPYYNQNRKGASNYLANDPFNIKHDRNISINLDRNYTFGVHYGKGNGGIHYYFLHNARLFPRPYPDFGPADTVREIACFAKGSLQLLCDLGVIPAIIVTNDWFTGLTPAYAKNGSFGDAFRGTTFVHICHNLEPTYEGRIYPHGGDGTLEGIYQFNPEWLIDPGWRQRVINPSRCAIMMSDQWATVSNSYKKDLQSFSPLKHLLNQKPNPFSYPNGIFKEKRLKILKDKSGGDRKECKKYIQQKYFGYQEADYSVPIYAFVGRLTQQKGVLLILDAVEELVHITNNKINILVGGMGDRRDPYVAACIGKINHLRGKYPHSFWADPNEFFTDGAKINFGSDFGLMPSLFEPGGIVQHEFFVAGTPVIAFRTGGLKDTVFEFQWNTGTGNGLTFDNHNYKDLMGAMQRSLDLFKNKEKYEICRKNAMNSAIDVADVSRAWCKEFYRLKGKTFFNYQEVKNVDLTDLPNFNPEKVKSAFSFNAKNNQNISNTRYGSMNNGNVNLYANAAEPDPRVRVNFSYKFDNRKPNSVLISGSFDKWQVKHPLAYDEILDKWGVTLKLKKGSYQYKYIVDGNWQINPKERSVKGQDGIENNVIEV